MRIDEFRIGGEFACGGRRYRCTDVGSRVVAAIRVDSVEVGSSGGQRRTLDRAEAQAEGWFNGPPYAVAEMLFDEDDREGCEPAA